MRVRTPDDPTGWTAKGEGPVGYPYTYVSGDVAVMIDFYGVDAVMAVVDAARDYSRHSHGNIGHPQRYRAREEARDVLLDALARLDASKAA